MNFVTTRLSTGLIIFAVVIALLLIAAYIFAANAAIEQKRNEIGALLGDDSRDWWVSKPHPREAEILAHLEEKYGEEFQIEFYFPEYSNGAVLIVPESNRNLYFTLQYEIDGRELYVYEMRDDYQVVLASNLAEDKILPLLDEWLGSQEIDVFIASYHISGAGTVILPNGLDVTASMPPADFAWKPADGLDVFFDSLDVEIYLVVSVLLRSQGVFDEIANSDVEVLAEAITRLGTVSSKASISISSPASFAGGRYVAVGDFIFYRWEVCNGEIIAGYFSYSSQ